MKKKIVLITIIVLVLCTVIGIVYYIDDKNKHAAFIEKLDREQEEARQLFNWLNEYMSDSYKYELFKTAQSLISESEDIVAENEKMAVLCRGATISLGNADDGELDEYFDRMGETAIGLSDAFKYKLKTCYIEEQLYELSIKENPTLSPQIDANRNRLLGEFNLTL